MIWVWSSLAMAGDPGLERGLHALRDEWRASTNRATLEERDTDYAQACRLGWSPACAPDRWRDDEGHPDPRRLVEVMQPPCDRGDVLACFAAHRFGPEALWSNDEIEARCNDGLAPACTMLAEVLHDVDPELSRAALERACLGTVDDAPLPWDPLACGRYGERHERARLVDACEAEDGRACALLANNTEGDEREDWLHRACAGGDATSCHTVARVITEALPDTPVLDEVPDPSQAQRRAERHRTLLRACGLGHLPSCTEAARDLASGRGVPVDLAAAHDGYWQACQAGDGAGCAWLAEAILDRQTQVFGVTPSELYARGCEMDHQPSCKKARRLSGQQRLSLRRLLARGHVRVLPIVGLRPWTGGTVGLTSTIDLPRVAVFEARRRVRITLEQGALDFTGRLLDRRATPENVSMFAGDWRQDAVAGKPWGVLLGAGAQWWQGAPRFDDDALQARVPGEATETFDLATVITRLDVERTATHDPRFGVQLSVAQVSAWDTKDRGASRGSVGRAVLTVFHRAPTPHPWPLRGGQSELSLYAGTSAEGPHAGAWFSDRRAIPLVRTVAGRDALSLTSDVVAGVRRGDVPLWLEHHHPPRFTPNLGTWQLLRGQPAALMRGEAPVRARAGLRWGITEFHGLPQHLGFALEPFVEAGTVVPDLTRPRRTWWRSDGGLSATLTLRRRLAIHAEALLVSDLDDGGFDLAPSIVVSRVLEPWR